MKLPDPSPARPLRVVVELALVLIVAGLLAEMVVAESSPQIEAYRMHGEICLHDGRCRSFAGRAYPSEAVCDAQRGPAHVALHFYIIDAGLAPAVRTTRVTCEPMGEGV